MVDYAAEIDRIAAENRRRMALLSDELDEVKQQTVRNAAACAEFFASEARREEQERLDAEASRQEYADTSEERERQEAEERARREAEAHERRAAELRAQHAVTAVPRANEPAVRRVDDEPRSEWQPSGSMTEAERREAELREQRAAIARAAAFRKANEVVRAVDDVDPDDEYYNRKSWLV
ncbi:flagellar biosynthesis GTPase FlhF [Nocardia sp. GAS34]|uniref:hypothetical protein n=1 Tax=unclassified Nocardia TaxID=2637762 RepID=UPI003D1C8B43